MMSTSDSQNQKSHTTVKRCLAAMAKQNKEACLITRACAGVNLKKTVGYEGSKLYLVLHRVNGICSLHDETNMKQT